MNNEQWEKHLSKRSLIKLACSWRLNLLSNQYIWRLLSQTIQHCQTKENKQQSRGYKPDFQNVLNLFRYFRNTETVEPESS